MLDTEITVSFIVAMVFRSKDRVGKIASNLVLTFEFDAIALNKPAYPILYQQMRVSMQIS